MTISAIFKSPLPSFSYHFKNGMTAVFINGKYSTDNQALIEELRAEIGAVGKTKSRHPYIFIDEDEYEIDSEALSPLEIIKLQAKEEARKELLEEQAIAQARALNAAANTSTSNSNPADFAASLGNSNTIAQAGAAESTGPAVGVGIAPATPSTLASSIGAKLTNFTAPSKG